MSKRSDVLDMGRCEIECIHPEHVGPLIGRVVGHQIADDAASLYGLLADPTRTRILHALSLARELCVCDLALLLGISQSALSHQLRLLRSNRVVARRKQGRVVYYRLADAHVRRMLKAGLQHAAEPSERSTEAAV
jgi:ArsR family transcriptional regulator, lead/cadmium/zinc/bismuth-responsive transcriptional repressor